MTNLKTKNDQEIRARRSPCPLGCSLDIIGDRWTLLVIRDLVIGKQKFKEFLESPEGVTTNILAERLKRLESCGIVERNPYCDNPPRFEYSLTDKGEDLRPVISAIVDWGQKHFDDVIDPQSTYGI